MKTSKERTNKAISKLPKANYRELRNEESERKNISMGLLLRNKKVKNHTKLASIIYIVAHSLWEIAVMDKKVRRSRLISFA